MCWNNYLPWSWSYSILSWWPPTCNPHVDGHHSSMVSMHRMLFFAVDAEEGFFSIVVMTHGYSQLATTSVNVSFKEHHLVDNGCSSNKSPRSESTSLVTSSHACLAVDRIPDICPLEHSSQHKSCARKSIVPGSQNTLMRWFLPYDGQQTSPHREWVIRVWVCNLRVSQSFGIFWRSWYVLYSDYDIVEACCNTGAATTCVTTGLEDSNSAPLTLLGRCWGLPTVTGLTLSYLVLRLTCPRLTIVGSPIPSMVVDLDQENPATCHVFCPSNFVLPMRYWPHEDTQFCRCQAYHSANCSTELPSTTQRISTGHESNLWRCLRTVHHWKSDNQIWQYLLYKVGEICAPLICLYIGLLIRHQE